MDTYYKLEPEDTREKVKDKKLSFCKKFDSLFGEHRKTLYRLSSLFRKYPGDEDDRFFLYMVDNINKWMKEEDTKEILRKYKGRNDIKIEVLDDQKIGWIDKYNLISVYNDLSACYSKIVKEENKDVHLSICDIVVTPKEKELIRRKLESNPEDHDNVNLDYL